MCPRRGNCDMRPSLTFILISGFTLHLPASDLSSIAVDFDAIPPGILSREKVEASFGKLEWENLGGRALVRDEAGGRVLEVKYPAGGVGSEESGAQFTLKLEPGRYATLRYRFRCAPDFPFVKGGKLPGLAAGGSRFTGGRPPGKGGGWSARYMWRREGALELYFYHPAMKGPFGERHSLEVRLEPERWYEVTQRVDTGDPGERNGRIEVEVDQVVRLRLTGLELSGTESGLVDSFLFSTFFGGASPDWAPPEDTAIFFDGIRISREKPTFSRE